MPQVRKLLPLFAVIFLGFFGYALTLTLFIPMLLDKGFPILPSDTSIHARAALSGLLLATYPLGQFLGSPIIGNLSDHFGRKKVLLVSLGCSVIGFLGMGFSVEIHSLTLLFLFALLTGLFESNMAISQSVIADMKVDTKLETKLMGYAYAACSLGYIVGPLVGGISGSALGYFTPFWITAIAVIGLIIWLAIYFRDQYVPAINSRLNLSAALTSFKSIFKRPKLTKIYIINFLIFFCVMGMYRVIPLYIVDKWKPSLHTYSLIISYVSLLCFLTNLFVLDWIAKHFSTKKFLGSLLIIGGILTFTIIIPHHFNWIWLTFGIAVIPTVMALPTCTVWLSKHSNTKEQGQVLGNNQALLVLGEASSAAIGGAIAAIFIPLPIALIGALLIGTGIAAFRMKMV